MPSRNQRLGRRQSHAKKPVSVAPGALTWTVLGYEWRPMPVGVHTQAMRYGLQLDPSFELSSVVHPDTVATVGPAKTVSRVCQTTLRSGAAVHKKGYGRHCKWVCALAYTDLTSHAVLTQCAAPRVDPEIQGFVTSSLAHAGTQGTHQVAAAASGR